MNDIGQLIFELSELERGQSDFLCMSFTIESDGLSIIAGCQTFNLGSESDRTSIWPQLIAAGLTVNAPHQGRLPAIESPGPHDDWVELLRDLADGPRDLASTGTGRLIGASTNGTNATITLEIGGQQHAHTYEFDGTYPAAVALDLATDGY